MYSRDEPFLRSLDCYFGIFKHQNNPLVSGETIRHSSTYIILYIFRWGQFIVSLTMFYWNVVTWM